MTDYEVIAASEAIEQTLNGIVDNRASHIAIYLTILFAYISAAYVAGRPL